MGEQGQRGTEIELVGKGTNLLHLTALPQLSKAKTGKSKGLTLTQAAGPGQGLTGQGEYELPALGTWLLVLRPSPREGWH